jgi:hypothetical protein
VSDFEVAEDHLKRVGVILTNHVQRVPNDALYDGQTRQNYLYISKRIILIVMN